MTFWGSNAFHSSQAKSFIRDVKVALATQRTCQIDNDKNKMEEGEGGGGLALTLNLALTLTLTLTLMRLLKNPHPPLCPHPHYVPGVCRFLWV
jgi:hypothetical protein